MVAWGGGRRYEHTSTNKPPEKTKEKKEREK
jgi:hypothetical protein